MMQTAYSRLVMTRNMSDQQKQVTEKGSDPLFLTIIINFIDIMHTNIIIMSKVVRI
jgi:hypothetical protein